MLLDSHILCANSTPSLMLLVATACLMKDGHCLFDLHKTTENCVKISSLSSTSRLFYRCSRVFMCLDENLQSDLINIYFKWRSKYIKLVWVMGNSQMKSGRLRQWSIKTELIKLVWSWSVWKPANQNIFMVEILKHEFWCKFRKVLDYSWIVC